MKAFLLKVRVKGEAKIEKVAPVVKSLPTNTQGKG